MPDGFQLTDPPVRNAKSYAQHKIGRHGKEQALPPSTALGARLRELRLGAGLTQRQMADRIGYGRAGAGRISDWERGYILPTLPILHRYARTFTTTVSALLEGVL